MSDLQIGQLMGQMTALISTVQGMSETITRLENRVTQNEKDILKVAVKMSVIGIAAGGIGSFAMNYALKAL